MASVDEYSMKTFKRILAGILIAVSALGLILCLAGIIGVWVINQPLTERLTGALDQAEIVLTLSQNRLGQIDVELTAAESVLANLTEQVTQAGDLLSENSPTLTFLSNTLGTELKPKIETTAEVISTLRETAISVNTTLETANSLPFVSVPSLPMEKLNAIDQQMQEMVTSVKSLGETVKNVEAGIIERSSTAILVPVEKLTGLIEKVHTPIVNFNSTLSDVEIRVVEANQRIPSLIDWGSVLVTLILLWFILAQASLLYGGWYYWKTGKIPAVQIQGSSNLSGG